MTLKNFKVPAIILGVVALLYLFLRKSGGASASASTTQPSTAASGVPLSTLESGSEQSLGDNATLPTQSVPKYGTGGAPADTSNTAHNPLTPATRASQILQQAFTAGSDAGSLFSNAPHLKQTAQSTATAKPTGCNGNCNGCKSQCDEHPDKPDQHFTDGQGSVAMTESQKAQWSKLEQKYPGLWDRWQKTVQIASVM